MHYIYRLKQPKDGACLPDRFSHSLLTKLERCPRQWWLLHSKYEGLQGHYPQAIYAATVSGKVVHAAMEAFAHALRQAGSPTPGSPDYFRTRQTFPLRQTIQKLRKKELSSIDGNPRTNTTLVSNGVSVDKCINAFKRLVMLSYSADDIKTEPFRGAGKDHGKSKDQHRSNYESSSHTNSSTVLDRDTEDQCGLAAVPSKVAWVLPDQVPCPASLPEVYLSISDPPLLGTIDLVKTSKDGDTIIEFKTGEPQPEHVSQSKLYAVLWWRWTGRPIRERLLLYTNYEPVTIGGINTVQLEEEKELLQRRISSVQAEFSFSPPPARPSPGNCQLCPVRQLCAEYWQAAETVEYRWDVESIKKLNAGEDIAEWRDIELILSNVVITEHGFKVDLNIPTSTNHPSTTVRLICNVPAKFKGGMSLKPYKARILNVSLQREGSAIRIIQSPLSEMFWS